MKLATQDNLGIFSPSGVDGEARVRYLLKTSGRLDNLCGPLFDAFVKVILAELVKNRGPVSITQQMVDRIAEQFMKELGEMG